MVSVVATWLFLNLTYQQLVEGKSVSRYPWGTPQFYTDFLQGLLSRAYTSLEWCLNSPPKPHVFASLPLQSNIIKIFLWIVGFLVILPAKEILTGLDLSFLLPLVISTWGVILTLIMVLFKEKDLPNIILLVGKFFISLITVSFFYFFITPCYYCIPITFPLKPLLLIKLCCINNNDNLYIFYNMPQLVPFYFINQVFFAFAIIVLLIYVFSKYILPRFVRLHLTRSFVSKI